MMTGDGELLSSLRDELDSALLAADDGPVTFHIRQALQHTVMLQEECEDEESR